ncbi:MAG TPA: 50S ribosomal protein L29 [Bacilli bacterium]|jgi:ribosomal protein L29|nr:50S ribosomal protein L29 [Mycoplasmatota bacterium]MDY4236748.1 50S ribosomal protein L29 [Bacilli bacterium]OLA94185.1 MAG: 50S ribosomal protein L29 [Mycoplasma sp. CAG:611_25_7]CDA23234.1 50S ribosomal protein L29 [Mycoplasma sp. CAG:611]HJJ08150.1 50S ribosomal protein L29 [Bacilli bacterium]
MNKIEELRKLTTEELNNKIKENKEELFNLRFQQATGNLEKPGRLKDLRKEVARMKTIIRERELNK